MKCPECGAEAADDEKFCGNCGAPLDAPAFEEAQPPVEGETIMSDPLPNEEPFAPPPAEEEAFAPPPPPAEEPAFGPPAEEVDYAPPPVTASEEKGKSKTGLIIGIVVAVVILLCCCCAVGIGIFLFSDAGQDLLYDLGLAMLPWVIPAL